MNHTADGGLLQFLDDVVYPQLTAEQIYSHDAHQFKRSGDKLRGGCPWHDSKSGTSFTVTANSLLWYCGGCCRGGSPLQYLWQLRGGNGSPKGDDFFAVVRELCDLAGVPFPEQHLTAEQVDRATLWENYRGVLREVIAESQAMLFGDGGSESLNYLRNRGFTINGIKELGLGLFPSVSTLQPALEQRGADVNLAASSGILNSDHEGYVVVPWNDEWGRPLTIYLAWPGDRNGDRPHKRALRNLILDREVVVHSKKSPLYFDLAQKAKHKDIVLVEGVFDAALAQVRGDRRVVACVAATLSTQQAMTLQRAGVSSVTICLDPDSAGDAGIGSCVRILSQHGIRSYVSKRLPDGLDPDDFINAHGIEEWKQLVGSAGPGWNYLAHRELGDCAETSTLQQRDAAIERAGRLLQEIPDPVQRHDVLELISSRTGVAVDQLSAKYDVVGAVPSPQIIQVDEADNDNDDESDLPLWPTPVDTAALHGLAGDVVRLIAPHTEADPIAILLQFLTAFGNAGGRSAHFQVESDRHYLKLFTCLVGATAKGRKGTSMGYIRRLFTLAAPTWSNDHVCNGLVSGEGLIWEVRDEIKQKKPRKQGGEVEYHEVITDEGVLDKRLLVVESEFSTVLKVIRREGNTLSQVVRDAWDECYLLRTMAKNSPARATKSHISIIGHITAVELRRQLTQVEIGNGFGNRFLWACVRRSKVLPHGGNLADSHIEDIAQRLTEALEAARFIERMQWSPEAAQYWEEVYVLLSADRPGLTGALTARAEAQTLRLAAIYAAIDGSPIIKTPHLEAALAVWQYCENSIRCIFGDRIGDPFAERILELLRATPEGLARHAIRQHFQRNKSSEEVGDALQLLMQHKLVTAQKVPTGGRSKTVYVAVRRDKENGQTLST